MAFATKSLHAYHQAHDADVARRAILEQREAEKQKQRCYEPLFEKIRISRGQGMSEQRLEQIYGRDLVSLEREYGNALKKTGNVIALESVAAPLSAAQARTMQRRAVRA